MMKRRLLLAAAITVIVSGTAEARPGDRLRAWLAERAAANAASAPDIPVATTIAYGSDSAQSLDFWPARLPADPAMAPAPLVIFVHGGGWQHGSKDNATGRWKPAHYPGEGYGFASINYRLVPDATVEQQAADVAAALKALLDRADALGIDRRRVVLMGHSAGAHLVALVGTDEQYLRAAGLSFAAVAGIVPIDGAAYDVAQQFEQAGPRMLQTYTAAFGTDPARQRRLSPTLQAASPNAPAFYIPHVQREDGVRQSNELAAALRAAGTPAETASFAGHGLMGHMEINRRLGDPDYPATPALDAWLARVFAQAR
jgi:arylformamidase